MRWFSRRRPAAKGSRTSSGPQAFVYIVVVGDAEGEQTVSSELMGQLVRATKEPALAALDRYFGTESWCSEIRTNTALQGPSIYFNLTLVVQPGETMASMGDHAGREFERSWDAATKRLLK